MKNNTNMRIPKKYQGMLDEIDHDCDGWWAYSKAGYKFESMDCHTASEDTQKELMTVIRSLVSCDCETCKELLKEK